ncbi:RloF [Brevibacterium yomogidense]|uniref:RloF n=2 Tax=Brevibacterium yomogidense TaxID=946573 RepID=A0A1X6X1L8_9MICO|nr:RloF [Brevibacterium yomogidense]
MASMSAQSTSTIDPHLGDPQLTASVESVKDILATLRPNIPSYQRPYAWTAKNVTELVDDIRRFRPSGRYRIGTFILNHSAEDDSDHCSRRPRPNIVDGQQRYLSFALIAHALLSRASDLTDRFIEDLSTAVDGISIPRRRDDRTGHNLRANHDHLRTIVSRWSPDELNDFTEFFLNDCDVVVLRVRDLDAAFQMFDSQNTRGRPLFPTDLLKAHHLREFSRTDPSRGSVLEAVREWEQVPPAEINHVIAAVLFPIKQWTVNRPMPRDGFSPHDVDLFKGIREDAQGNGRYRWAHPVLLAKAAVDRFHSDNSTLLRHGVVDALDFPFQITQPVIDGEMFFRMVSHYVSEARRAGIAGDASSPGAEAGDDRDPRLAEVHEMLDAMPPGTGYRYVRELFDCLLMAYLDRFGWYDVEHAALFLARYAYLLRVHLQRVYPASVDIHARRGHDRIPDADGNLFADIVHALDPRSILDRPLPSVDEAGSEPLRRLYGLILDTAERDEETQREGIR